MGQRAGTVSGVVVTKARFMFLTVADRTRVRGVSEQQPGDHLSIRISNEDREKVAQILHNAMAEGRIDLKELEERLDTVYAAKTFVSGAGLPVLFKETLPGWLGVETLHTAVSRGDVSARDVLALLATRAGVRLALGQALVVKIGRAHV